MEVRRRRRRSGEPPRPIQAAALSRWLDLPGRSRETIRRRVRELVASLRDQGVNVCAINSAAGGYYLPVSTADLEAEIARRRHGGLAHLAAAAEVRRSTELADASGQFALFSLGKRPGCALLNGPSKAR